MVDLSRERVETPTLINVTKREVARYAGYSPLARLFPVLDDERQTYAVIIIEDDPQARPAYTVVMARVVDDNIIIEEDRSFDKPLHEALMVNGSIPREQIILVYAGETIPTENADQ